MKLEKFIAPEIPELNLSDNGVNALNLMEQFGVRHLPIVQDGQFLGLVCEEEILSLELPTQPFFNIHHEFPMICLQARHHIFDALKVMVEQKLSLLPLIDEELHYIGSITVESMLQALANAQAVHDPGAVIVLEMNSNDYSLSQIAQIVEGNDARILSTTLSAFPESTRVEVTLKINKEDLNPIIQTFNRYEYNVVDTYMEPRYSEDLRERYEEFMKFLNM